MLPHLEMGPPSIAAHRSRKREPERERERPFIRSSIHPFTGLQLDLSAQLDYLVVRDAKKGRGTLRIA